MEGLHQSAFLQALGWSVTDSLWQMGLLWLFYIAGVKFLKPAAVTRHNLAVISLAAGSLWFIGNFLYRIINQPAEGFFSQFFGNGNYNFLPDFFTAKLLTSISGAYLMLAGGMFLRFIYLYIKTRQLNSLAIEKAPVDIRLFSNKMATLIGIKKPVKLSFTHQLNTPVTIGFFKPLILLPITVASHLNAEEAETIILHELYHIKRNDYLINILVNFAAIFLFFNPFALLIIAAIKVERENSCDDQVMQFNYLPSTYASALYQLEKLRRNSAPSLAMAATGKGPLLLRIRRILAGEDVTKVSASGLFYGLIALLFFVLLAIQPGNDITKSDLAVLPNFTREFIKPPVEIKPEMNTSGHIKTLSGNSIATNEPVQLKEVLTIHITSPITKAPQENKLSKEDVLFTPTELIPVEMDGSENLMAEEKEIILVKLQEEQAFTLANSSQNYEKNLNIPEQNTPFLPGNVLEYRLHHHHDTIPLEAGLKNIELRLESTELKLMELYNKLPANKNLLSNSLELVQTDLNKAIAGLNIQKERLLGQPQLQQVYPDLNNLKANSLKLQNVLDQLKIILAEPNIKPRAQKKIIDI